MKSARAVAIVAALLGGLAGGFAYADDAKPAATTASDAGDPTQSPAIELAGTTAPDLARGKRVFQTVANCARCHGWPGDGLTGKDPRSPGIPANLRKSSLDTNTMIQVVSCGIPGSQMPYQDDQAYQDARCYGTTLKDYTADQTPQPGKALNNQDIINVVAYVQQTLQGKGDVTKAECEAYFKPGAAACADYK
ncbi:MAG: c-type cytochrome [Devosia sp.]|nr:c-type cytochrome [Devosia sp.]